MTPASNPFEHQHEHHDDAGQVVNEVLDPAQESLADALRYSFGILTVLMVFVLIAYAFSGWFNVDQQHAAVRLRFGRIVGDSPQTKVLLPGGPHLAFPYPIDQVIEVSTASVTIKVDNAFWWEVQAWDEPGQPKRGPLLPERDGWLLTADANIIHARWSMTYKVRQDAQQNADPEAVLDYVRNIGNDEVAEEIVRAAAEQGIVQTAAATPADDLMKGKFDKTAALDRIQSTLDKLETGLLVSDLTITEPTMPGLVSDVYQKVTEAEADKAKLIGKALKKRDEILKRTAGEAHEPLWQLIGAYEQAHVGNTEEDEKQAEKILSILGDALSAERIEPGNVAPFLEIDAPVRIGGEVAAVIRRAAAYKTEIVNKSITEATEFENLQPQFRINPRVFMIDRLSATLENILTSPTVETHYMDTEMHLIIESNPDPEIKKRDEEEKISQEQAAREEAMREQAPPG